MITICNKCNRWLPPTAFAKNTTRPSGLQGQCRQCRSTMASGYRERNREAHAERAHAEYERNKGRYRKRDESQPKAARAARRTVQLAIQRGDLSPEPCHCGKKAEAHHDDYAKPLAVRWMCRSHHQAWHRMNGPGLNR